MSFVESENSAKYREIAVAADNQTYAQQLTQLKTTWDTLTTEQKTRCAILYNNANLVFLPSYFGMGAYIAFWMDANSFRSYCMNIKDATYMNYSTAGGGIVNNSSVNNNSALSLLLLE